MSPAAAAAVYVAVLALAVSAVTEQRTIRVGSAVTAPGAVGPTMRRPHWGTVLGRGAPGTVGPPGFVRALSARTRAIPMQREMRQPMRSEQGSLESATVIVDVVSDDANADPTSYQAPAGNLDANGEPLTAATIMFTPTVAGPQLDANGNQVIYTDQVGSRFPDILVLR